MSDVPSKSDSRGDTGATGAGDGRGSTGGMPRWVKVLLITALVFVLALVVSRLAGVRHGPGLHAPRSEATWFGPDR